MRSDGRANRAAIRALSKRARAERPSTGARFLLVSAVATRFFFASQGGDFHMANDNEGSRAFLAIVLGGIVLALVIAAYFMYGHKGDTNVKVEQPVTETQPPA